MKGPGSYDAVPNLRVVLELAVGEGVEPLQGNVKVAGSLHAQRFSGALDLLRILETEAQREHARRCAL